MLEYLGNGAAAQLAFWWNEMHRKQKNSCAIVFSGCFLFIHHLPVSSHSFRGCNAETS